MSGSSEPPAADTYVSYRGRGKSLDELMDDFDRGVPAGEGKGPEVTSIAFQYRVAKAQEHWTQISAVIAGTGVIVAIAAVIVAAVK